VIVDAHVHLLPDRLAAAIRRFFMQHALGSFFTYPHDATSARACIVAAGVDRCWSLPYAHKPGMASALNRWMAEAFAGDPVVVAGATVHPADDVAAVVGEALDALGLRLVKLHCSVGKFDADDARLDPLWRKVSASGHPVVVHIGQSAGGTTDAPELATVGRVAQRWPDARIVIAHCGAPAVDAALAILRETRSTYADLTPIGLALAPVDRARIAGLEQRLLLGSDAPNTGVSIEQAVAHVRALGLDAAAETAVLGGTAERLLAR
jgi:hypothetical protein